MFKKISSICICLFVVAFALNVTFIHAENYPGIEVEMNAGDILYSSKTGKNKPFGHVAIVGNDHMIYHVNEVIDQDHTHSGGKSDTMSKYRSRHLANEAISIYRFDASEQLKQKTAHWAQNYYSVATQYKIPNPFIREQRTLNILNSSYCSKFVWQALYYGLEQDITLNNATDEATKYILPIEFTYYPFYYVGQFQTA